MTRTGRPKIEKPKSEPQSVRFDERTLKKLQEYCDKHKVKKGKVIQRAVEKFLEENEA